MHTGPCRASFVGPTYDSEPHIGIGLATLFDTETDYCGGAHVNDLSQALPSHAGRAIRQ